MREAIYNESSNCPITEAFISECVVGLRIIYVFATS